MRQELPGREEIDRLPADGGPQFNRLIFESSPYLLQHARNPVDWRAWGAEAFEAARAADRPIFLSVGYSTCHRCHVMARESFEDAEIASLLNARFIPVKVDREERPEIDEIYMAATELLTGRGGWPNSVWLTPDGRPWFAGTYFPPEGSGGRPGFRDLLERLARTWEERRDEVEAQANRLREAIRSSMRPADPAPVSLDRGLLRGAVEALSDRFDDRHGGFGNAPKFPPHSSLRLLLAEHRRTGEAHALTMATATLDAMSRGGIHDQVGGGFHRYATDARWLVPHFEKMLYDNGQLAAAYAEAHAITGSAEYEIAARGICDWVLREMRDERGGFYSALDADSEGVEGKFYLWAREEIIDVLGEEQGALVADIFRAREGGNFREEATGRQSEANILHLDPAGIQPELWPFVESAKGGLLARRNARIRPHRDEKVLAAWNGLMIGGLATAGRLLGERRYVEAAAGAAEFVLEEMVRDGRLMRTWRDGEARLPGYLDDYAFVAQGLLELHDATGGDRWLGEARTLADEMLERFEDESAGGFYFTAADGEELLARTRRPWDQAVPSGNGVAALVLVRLAEETGEDRYLESAERALRLFSAAMRNAPTATETLLVAAARYLELTDAGERGPRPAAAEPDARAVRGPVTVEAFASHRAARPGEQVRVAVRVEVADGWHITSRRPLQDYLTPTELALAGEERLELAEVAYPDGTRIAPGFSDEPISVYEGEVWVTARVEVAGDAAAGATAIRLMLSAQACDETECAPAESYALELPLRIGEQGDGGGRHRAVFERLGSR